VIGIVLLAIAFLRPGPYANPNTEIVGDAVVTMTWPVGSLLRGLPGELVGRGLAVRAGLRGGQHPRRAEGLIERQTRVGAASHLSAKIAAERLGVTDAVASGAADFSAAVGLQQ
jgi:hypothetical protein